MTRLQRNAQVTVVSRSVSLAGYVLRRILMKQLILAAVAVMSLGVGSAFAQSFSHAAPSQGNEQGYRQ
jgi:hypothetical protein